MPPINFTAIDAADAKQRATHAKASESQSNFPSTPHTEVSHPNGNPHRKNTSKTKQKEPEQLDRPLN